MRASKSDSKDTSEKSNVHSSTMMSEAATLRLVMEQNIAETDERCDVTPQGETGILIKPISTKVHLQVTDKGLIGMTYSGQQIPKTKKNIIAEFLNLADIAEIIPGDEITSDPRETMPSRALSMPVFALQLDPSTDLSTPSYQKATRELAERVRHFVAAFGSLPLENLQRDLSPKSTTSKSTTNESDNPYFPDPSLPWEDQPQQPAEWSLTKHSLIEYERCSTRFRAAKELMDALDQIAKVRANSRGTLKDQREATYYPSLLRWIILYALSNMHKETHVELAYLPKQAKSLSTTAKSSWQVLVERFADESGLDSRQTENEYGGSQSYYDSYDYWAEHNSNADPRIYGISPSMMCPLRAKQLLATGKVGTFPPTFDALMDDLVTNLRIFFSAFDPDSQHRWDTYNFAPLFSDDCDRWVRALFAGLPTDKKSINADPITTAHALYLRSLMYDAAWRIVDREYNQRYHDIDVRVAFRKDSSAMPQNKDYPIRPYSGVRYWMYRTDNLLSFISYADLTAENVWRCLGCHRWIEANRMGQPRKWCPVCREKVRSLPRRKKAED